MNQAGLTEGTVIDGRYKVLSRLGSGGMADVYLADDEHLGRRVAVKVLHARFAQDPEFVKRFQREASSAAGLQHKNVVNIFDRGETNGIYYIAMEYLPGRSLKELIQVEGQMQPARAIGIAVQILAAARFAHSRGVVHRDFKPQNIIVDEDQNAKVTDFGIALRGTSDMTEAGAMLGTAQYISPEQAQGREVGPATDIYSIGVVLYEMLTGHVPFSGDTAVAIALKHVNEMPVSPRSLAPQIPPELDVAVMRALAKDPAHRFRDAGEFSAALESVLVSLTAPPDTTAQTAVFAAPTVVSPPPLPPAPLPPATIMPDKDDGDHRKRWFWIAGITALVLVAGAFAFLMMQPKQVTVPYVIGQTYEDAKTELATVGLESTSYRKQDPAPVGEVIDQNPLRDDRVDEGSVVKLTVSSGPGTVVMPDVAGLPKDRAVEKLQQVSLTATIQKAYSEEQASGDAIRTVPASGQPVERGSEVDLFISKGPKEKAVPDVVGTTKDDATTKLESAGFKVEVSERDSTEVADQVLEQTPNGGTDAAEGATVKLVVASGSNTVPTVTDSSESDATDKLRAAGFKVTVTTIDVTDAAQDGIVQSQSPTGGSKPLGTTVTVTVGNFTAP